MGLIDDFSGKARSLTGRAYKKMASTVESEETKESVAKLKESISEVGKQLKESGKAISSQLEHGSCDSNKDSSSSPQPTASDDTPPSPPSDVAETEARPTSKPLKKAKPKTALIIAAVLACLLLGGIALAAQTCSGTTDTTASNPSTGQEEFNIRLNIECEQNMLFSTYNVRASIDGEKLGIIEHGDIASFETKLTEGNHTLTLNKEGDSEIDGETMISVEGDASFSFSISCSQSNISVEKLSAEDWDERYAQRLETIVGQSGQTAQKINAQLEALDYIGQGYALQYKEGKKELTDFDPKKYDVTEGLVDSEAKTITLTLESNIPVEVNFSEEEGRRAVVVAITNCYATDVFNEAGTYDSSRFHNYADMSGYYMTVEEKGTWSVTDESTRDVSGMVLKAAGSDFYARVDAQVTFNGTDFTINHATVKYASSLEAITSQDENQVGTEKLKPSDSSPYLTVPSSLIADDRNTQAESQAREAENAAAEEQTTYDSWVSSQFSWWDGKNKAFVDAVKERLNDEKSFEHIETGYIACKDEETLASVNSAFSTNGEPVANLNDIYVTMEFSAKNGFNGTIKSRAHGIIHYPSGSVTVLLLE